MKRSLAIACLLVIAATPAVAAHIPFSPGLAGLGGWGLGPGSVGRGGGLLVSSFTELMQERFENRLTDLMMEYDDGLAELDDYYASDDYADVVDDVERLVDRYDWFVTGFERSIDRLGDVISAANDRLEFLNELLTDYQSRDDLAETRFERIEDWITGLQDHLQFGIDLWTEQQSTLSEKLATYQGFQTQLTTYFDEIVVAGGGTVGDGDGEAALAATNVPGMEVGTECVMASFSVGGAVPEPGSCASAMLAAVAAFHARRLWGRRFPREASGPSVVC
jgi:hypothetical protein